MSRQLRAALIGGLLALAGLALFQPSSDELRWLVRGDPTGAALGRLPLIQLHLSNKDLAAFERLYQQYEHDPDGEALFLRHNLWRKARLTHLGETYDVRVKAHGRRPNGHRAGRYLSYSIKLLNRRQLRNATRFNLVIQERIRAQAGVISAVAEHFDLLASRGDHVRVRVNDLPQHAYLFEHRLNDAYMEVHERPSLRRFRPARFDPNVPRSCVYREPFDPELIRRDLTPLLAERGFAPHVQAELLQRYLDLNGLLLEETQGTGTIGEFVEAGYIARFEAARALLGLTGHGADPSNLYLFLDLADGRFYPALTRDDFLGVLKDPQRVEAQLDTYVTAAGTTRALHLFRHLSANDTLRQAKYRELHAFLEDPKRVADMLGALRRAQTLAESVMLAGGGRQAMIVADNAAVLRRQLSEVQPQAQLQRRPGAVSLTIWPRSLVALDASLRLSGVAGAGPLEIDVSADGSLLYRGLLESTATLDLTANLPGPLCDGLDLDSNRVSRAYRVEVKGPALDVGELALELSNQITGEPVTPIWVERSEPEAAPSEPTPPSQARALHPALTVEGRRASLGPGTVEIQRDLVLPAGVKLSLRPGTHLRLGPGVLLLCQAGLDVEGTEEAPVTIAPSDPDKPYGSVAVLGDRDQTTSRIQHLRISGGSERCFAGALFTGGLSIHDNRRVWVLDSHFTGHTCDDALNVKYGEVQLERCEFVANHADQVDLDACTGRVLSCRFVGPTDEGDGLDVSRSTLVIADCSLEGNGDKGLSVGEASRVLLLRSRLRENGIGVAVKDQSLAYLVDVTFQGSREIDVAVYCKKPVFGGGSAHLVSGGVPSARVDATSRLETGEATLPNLQDTAALLEWLSER